MTAGEPPVPALLAELREKARTRLDPVRWDFFEGGAGEEIAAAANVPAFRRPALLPRVLRGAGQRPARDQVVVRGPHGVAGR
jgi:4-hydroxymandelate oxidase